MICRDGISSFNKVDWKQNQTPFGHFFLVDGREIDQKKAWNFFYAALYFTKVILKYQLMSTYIHLKKIWKYFRFVINPEAACPNHESITLKLVEGLIKISENQLGWDGLFYSSHTLILNKKQIKIKKKAWPEEKKELKRNVTLVTVHSSPIFSPMPVKI